MATGPASQLVNLATADEFAQTLLEVSLTGFILFRPLYAEAGGPIQDLAYDHLNPAAQQMLALPVRPTDTFLTLYPAARETGIFQFYAGAFHSGQTEHYQVNYQHDGLDGYFLLAARRSGEQLVVSFTDTNDHPRSAVEEALRESQARERAARAEAEAERRQLREILSQLPAQVATYRGPDHVYEFINDRYQRYFSQQRFTGQSIRQALPATAANGLLASFDRVYQTGEPFYNPEQEFWHTTPEHAQPQQLFLSLTLLPLRDAQNQVTGILDFSYEVTAQVQARQQVQDLNQALAAANAELESRVQQRTQELQASHHATAALQTEVLAAAQRQVQEREDLYQVFAQSQAVVLFLRGPAHHIEYLNGAAERLFPGRQLRGRPLAESQPEAAAQGFVALLDQVYQTGEPHLGTEVPLRVANEAGQLITTYFNFTYQAHREHGEVAGIGVFAYDVTEQVLARQQREAQQAELQRLFAQAPMAITVLRGPTFIIEQANENAEVIWGRSAADVLGQPHFEAIPGSAGQGFEELLTGVLQSGEPVVLHEVPIELRRAHTGRPDTGYYTIIFKPLRDEHQRVTRVVVMWTESTDQVLARQQVQDLNKELAAINSELAATNAELQKSNARLLRTNTDLGTFVYTASHDLKAPITNIEGLVLALRDTLPAAVQQDGMVGQLLTLLDSTVHRFLATIMQLTDLSRLQRAYEEPAESLALAPVVEGVLADLAPAIAEAGTAVQVQVPAGLRVSLAPASLRSIVYNLLSNAIKYRAPGRPAQVWLQAEQQPQGVVFTVRDNGLGLTDSQQQRLFQVFQRLHTHVEGSGVGLYMIKRLLENAGATIAVTSTVDVGTTFTLLFPD